MKELSLLVKEIQLFWKDHWANVVCLFFGLFTSLSFTIVTDDEVFAFMVRLFLIAFQAIFLRLVIKLLQTLK